MYIIHRFDYDTPIEETMEVLHSLVAAVKVRAIGAIDKNPEQGVMLLNEKK